LGLSLAALCAVTGCDRLMLAPEKAAPTPAPAAAAAPFDSAALRAHAGESYAAFAATGSQYTPDGLGLAAADRARLWRGMAAPQPAELLTGGGAEALVFKGCAETGCGDGLAIVAVDTANGGVFAAVRDVGGADVLAPNDRIEALLRLNSPTRRWDDAPAVPPAPARP
jgi:hypothetical protein